MEFLNTLYESEYFIYIVGGTIGGLLILFLIILLSGKKKDKIISEEKVALTNPVPEKSVIADTVPVKDASLDVTKEFKPEDLAALQTKMAEPVKEVVPPVMPVLEEVEDLSEEMNEPIKPAVSYTSVMEEIGEPIKPVVSFAPTMEEEKDPFKLVSSFTPEVEEEPFKPVEPVMPPMDTLITPEPRPTTVLNNQFSSVFVDKKPTEMEEVKMVNPETLVNKTPEEKITFQVTEENELPKLNNENKEL